MRRTAFLGALLALSLSVSAIAFAQESTATPEAPASESTTQAETTQPAAQTAVTTFRVAHLAAGAPDVVVFINGEASDIQTLSFPDLTGWVEVPSGSFQLSLVPLGGTEAAFGPVTINNTRGFLTLAVTAGANGGLQAFAIQEDVSALLPGEARATVFHAIPGAPAFGLVSNGEALGGGTVGFPGAGTGAQAGGSMQNTAGFNVTPLRCIALTNAGSASQSAVTAAEATPEAGQVSTTGSDAQATQEAGATGAGTSTVQAGGFGATINNCALSVHIPAGAAGRLEANLASPLVLNADPFQPGSYNFVALYGSADAPQVFVSSVQIEQLTTLGSWNQGQTGTGGTSGDMMQPESTAEATPQAGG